MGTPTGTLPMNIPMLPGDDIGPEIAASARALLTAPGKHTADLGGSTGTRAFVAPPERAAR
jgi:isocitrate/isopropylmalate dehydrogenase